MMFINIGALVLIVFIVWWFWLYKSKQVEAIGDDTTVVVEDGIYQPSSIKVPAGQETKLTFIRKDATPCAGTVLFPDFDISQELPLNKSITITLPAMTAGKYAFHCQMQMYKGLVTVV
ncbi:cupredoxin domain-containing protein [Paraglaciecola sp.]|uniref:cupredoxin domain-containing protein n=1 Tax=Paraglaciecola sp. TaxID=1920173 RepID=UPI0030F4314D